MKTCLSVMPCPFCGEPPIILRVGEKDEGEMVECVTAGCINPSASYYGKDIARKKWNQRKPITQGVL